MKRRLVRLVEVATLLLLLVPMQLVAQAVAAKPTVVAPVMVAHRDPALAGVLSGLVLSGLGSFYAGNTGHGIRHLAIEAGGIAIVLATTSCGDVFTCSSASAGLIGIGVILGNAIWSTFTAVHDANAFNRAQAVPSPAGRMAGSVYLAPNMVGVHLAF